MSRCCRGKLQRVTSGPPTSLLLLSDRRIATARWGRGNQRKETETDERQTDELLTQLQTIAGHLGRIAAALERPTVVVAVELSASTETADALGRWVVRHLQAHQIPPPESP